jgi:hypothetical protein
MPIGRKPITEADKFNGWSSSVVRLTHSLTELVFDLSDKSEDLICSQMLV